MTTKIYTISLARQLPRQQNGFNLVELMVAMVLGAFLVLGVTNILFSDQASFNATSRLARVQEKGQMAKNILINDLKRARYMGANVALENLAGTQGAVGPAASCNAANNSWALMVEEGLFGLDNSQVAGSGYNCITNLINVPGAYIGGDILTVRFASPWQATAFQNNTLYIRSTFTASWIFYGQRASNPLNDEIVFAGTSPDPISSTHELMAYSYYIGNSGRQCSGQAIPSLFRVRLNDGVPVPVPVPEEIVPGIEDFQVEFSLDGVNYVTADNVPNDADGLPDWNAVVATQFWILARSECAETGFTDNDNTRSLSSDLAIIAAPDDGFRRQLYSGIVSHRN